MITINVHGANEASKTITMAESETSIDSLPTPLGYDSKKSIVMDLPVPEDSPNSSISSKTLPSPLNNTQPVNKKSSTKSLPKPGKDVAKSGQGITSTSMPTPFTMEGSIETDLPRPVTVKKRQLRSKK